MLHRQNLTGRFWQAASGSQTQYLYMNPLHAPLLVLLYRTLDATASSDGLRVSSEIYYGPSTVPNGDHAGVGLCLQPEIVEVELDDRKLDFPFDRHSSAHPALPRAVSLQPGRTTVYHCR
jgi:hypothetical protein